MSTPICDNLRGMMATSDGYAQLAARIAALNETRVTYHSISEIKSIVADYYHHDYIKLTEPERWAHPDFIKLAEDDLKPPAKEQRLFREQQKPKILIRSTGKPLRERLLWADLRAVFQAFDAESHRVGEIAIPGWTGYVLRRWVSGCKVNPDWPEVKSHHTETAVRKLIARIEMLL